MPIYKGNKKLGAIEIDGKAIKAVYKGNDRVYLKDTPVTISAFPTNFNDDSRGGTYETTITSALPIAYEIISGSSGSPAVSVMDNNDGTHTASITLHQTFSQDIDLSATISFSNGFNKIYVGILIQQTPIKITPWQGNVVGGIQGNQTTIGIAGYTGATTYNLLTGTDIVSLDVSGGILTATANNNNFDIYTKEAMYTIYDSLGYGANFIITQSQMDNSNDDCIPLVNACWLPGYYSELGKVSEDFDDYIINYNGTDYIPLGLFIEMAIAREQGTTILEDYRLPFKSEFEHLIKLSYTETTDNFIFANKLKFEKNPPEIIGGEFILVSGTIKIDLEGTFFILYSLVYDNGFFKIVEKLFDLDDSNTEIIVMNTYLPIQFVMEDGKVDPDFGIVEPEQLVLSANSVQFTYLGGNTTVLYEPHDWNVEVISCPDWLTVTKTNNTYNVSCPDYPVVTSNRVGTIVFGANNKTASFIVTQSHKPAVTNTTQMVFSGFNTGVYPQLSSKTSVDITYCNGILAVTNTDGTIMLSRDYCKTWSLIDGPFNANTRILSGGGKFCLYAGNQACFSTDLINYTSISSLGLNIKQIAYSTTGDNNYWGAIGDNLEFHITENDGNSWKSILAPTHSNYIRQYMGICWSHSNTRFSVLVMESKISGNTVSPCSYGILNNTWYGPYDVTTITQPNQNKCVYVAPPNTTSMYRYYPTSNGLFMFYNNGSLGRVETLITDRTKDITFKDWGSGAVIGAVSGNNDVWYCLTTASSPHSWIKVNTGSTVATPNGICYADDLDQYFICYGNGGNIGVLTPQ